MRLASREQALLIDEISQTEFGLSGRDLMNQAGTRMAELILKKFKQELDKGVIIVAGPGNNGGDGRVIAKRLNDKGVAVRVFSPQEFLGVKDYPEKILIDAIFGVGLSRNLSGDFLAAVHKINGFLGLVISIDVPSGLNASTGAVMGAAVKAGCTLSVWPNKVGLYLREGATLAGKIFSIRVSFPPEVTERVAREYFLFSSQLAKQWLPLRDAKSNKSKFGHAFIVAGSEGKWGAAVLSVRAAFRAGAGYVVHTSTDRKILSEVPEAMSVKFSELVDSLTDKKQVAVAIGPGAGFSDKILPMLRTLLKMRHPVVLDADALTMFASNPFKLRPDWIITPHSGELARLLGCSVLEVESDPLAAAKLAWKKFGCTVVLKGFYTVVVSGYTGRSVIVPKGNVALAKAGTGDVLTGLITGLLAQDLHPLKASLLAVFVHGLSADRWVKKNSRASLAASDLIQEVSRSMKSIER